MDLMKALNSRYSTKEFDSTKKISDEHMEVVESLLQLSPSSTNVQPWHFVLATTEEGKGRVAKASHGFFKFNEQKVLDASAVVVFAAKAQITEDHLERVLEQEDQDGRFAKEQFKKDVAMGRKTFSDLHKYDFKDQHHWAEKQLYLNLGSFLLGLAHLEIDALPMEGLDMKVLDEEFGLRQRGFTSAIVVALGYRTETDFNAQLPKSRLPKDVIITRI